MDYTSVYNTYVKLKYPDSDLTKEERKFLINKFKKLDQDDLEASFMMIYYYYLSGTSKPLEVIKWNENNKINGIEIKLNTLPIKLQHMLYKFCCVLHNNDPSIIIKLS